MTRSAARTAVALCLAALATGVPRAHAERTAAACACHHTSAAACSCARGPRARVSGRAGCVSPCCKVPETARPPQSGPEPMLLAARAVPLPRPAQRPSSPAAPASGLDRVREPETPPPRRA